MVEWAVMPGSRVTSKKSTVPLVPTDRDVRIIRAVQCHRLLRSRDHLVPLFGGSANVLRRLQVLTRARFLNRLKRRPHEQAVYSLGKQGAKLLRDRFGVPMPSSSNWGERDTRLTEQHVEHTLLVADVLVGVELACQAQPDTEYVSEAELIERFASPEVKRRVKVIAGHPLKWDVTVRNGKWRGTGAIEPDGFFGIRRGQKTNYFFLEADRGTMSVIPEQPTFKRASIFKKMLQYRASWENARSSETLTSRRFGLSNIRTLFVLSTDARGDTRLNRCLEANRHFQDGRGTGLFLFAKRETLLEAPDILAAELITGTGKRVSLQ